MITMKETGRLRFENGLVGRRFVTELNPVFQIFLKMAKNALGERAHGQTERTNFFMVKGVLGLLKGYISSLSFYPELFFQHG